MKQTIQVVSHQKQSFHTEHQAEMQQEYTWKGNNISILGKIL